MNAISKRNLTAVLVAAAFGMSLSAPSIAQDKSPAATPAQASEAGQTGRDVRASKLIGKEVRNASGEKLGEIQDLIVDAKAERVHYAVLAFGGALGLGEKLFAYPLKTFKPAGDKDELVLNVDKEKMKNAPGFERNRWPDLADNRYRTDVDRYFGGDAAGKPRAGERLMRASELIGKNVDDRQGKNAGEIEDLVVNLSTEKIRYVVLDFDKAWSPDDKLVTLPMGVLNFPQRKDRDLVLDVTRDQINTARGFDEGNWPDLNASAYRRETDAYLSRFQTERTARPARGKAGPETTSGGSK